MGYVKSTAPPEYRRPLNKTEFFSAEYLYLQIKHIKE